VSLTPQLTELPLEKGLVIHHAPPYPLPIATPVAKTSKPPTTT
jgi:hypothetical protein